MPSDKPAIHIRLYHYNLPLVSIGGGVRIHPFPVLNPLFHFMECSSWWVVLFSCKSIYFLFLLKFVRTTVGEMAFHQAIQTMRFSRPRFHFSSNHAPELKLSLFFSILDSIPLDQSHTWKRSNQKRTFFQNLAETKEQFKICSLYCHLYCHL